MTKRNIYQKLHDACLTAGSVKKGTKATGGINPFQKALDEGKVIIHQNML